MEIIHYILLLEIFAAVFVAVKVRLPFERRVYMLKCALRLTGAICCLAMPGVMSLLMELVGPKFISIASFMGIMAKVACILFAASAVAPLLQAAMREEN